MSNVRNQLELARINEQLIPQGYIKEEKYKKCVKRFFFFFFEVPQTTYKNYHYHSGKKIRWKHQNNHTIKSSWGVSDTTQPHSLIIDDVC